MKQTTRFDYEARVARVLTHIRESSRPSDLTLAALANVACLSPFHFHRVFSVVTGESVGTAVRRIMLERAGVLLRSSRQSVGAIANAVGFTTVSHLSRSFKAAHGVSPTAFRQGRQRLKNSKTRQLQGRCLHQDEVRRTFRVELRSVPARQVGYVPVRQPWSPGRLAAALETLHAWAHRHLAAQETRLIGLSFDDDDLTPPEVMCYELGLVLPSTMKIDGGLLTRALPPCTAAVTTVRGSLAHIASGWEALYHWLASSTLLPANLPAWEAYVDPPDFEANDFLHLECAVPVERWTA